MNPESEISVFDRLSQNDRAILSKPNIKAVINGIKPAAFEDWYGTIKEPELVAKHLRSIGIDALVTPHLVMDRAQVAHRIAEEPELARMAGYKDGESIDALAESIEKTKSANKNNVLRGFLLGFPASAILGFRLKEELILRGVPAYPEWFFYPDFFIRIPGVSTDEETRAQIALMAAEYAALPNLKWEHGPDRPSPEAESALFDRHRDEISGLYQRLWNLPKQDADAIAWSKGVYIPNDDPDNIFTFLTFGKNADKAPDVLALKAKVANLSA